MVINEQVLRSTQQRWDQRQASREASKAGIGAGELLRADSQKRVDKRLDHLRLNPGAVRAILESDVSLAALPSSVAAGDSVALERIMGTNDLVPVFFLENALLASKSIGRISIRSFAGQLIGYGSGFLVSPRLLLTNNHVLSNPQEAATSVVEFNYQVGLDGQIKPSKSFDLVPGEFFLTHRDLDYTLVAVQAPKNGHDVGFLDWNRLVAEPGKAIKGEYLNIIQHPNGEPKQLALRENELLDVLDDFLHYQSDTAPGSSGSPVFNDQWQVVALHHSGVPKRDQAGNILSRDGKIWQEWMGEHRIDWVANEGVRISKIVEHIKKQRLAPDQDRLRDEMFKRVPQREVGTPQVPSSPLARSTSVDKSQASITWTIPLNVTVRLGSTDEAQTALQYVHTPVAGVEIPSRPLPGLPGPEDPDVKEALEELERGRTRVYYDSEKDSQSKLQYYANLDVSRDSDSLFHQLNRLVTETHRDSKAYSPSKHLYPWIDLHHDRKLRSIYSGEVFDPEHLIREDFRIGVERTIRLRELLATEAFRGAERLSEELDLLEASLPYNCEHVVPQSWFERKEPMRGDLHHLFACGSRCNSFRGNHAYYDFPDFEEAFMDDCGKREQNRFEPHSGKGSVSRSTLYFLLRYPGQINSNSRELSRDRLETLIAWHRQFPVSEYERHRNMAIFEKQGNRNPVIDFPELAEKINFELGFGN